MFNDKIRIASLAAGAAMWAAAYFIFDAMLQTAQAEKIWQYEPFYFLLTFWAGAVLLFSRAMTTLPQRRQWVLLSVGGGVAMWAGFMPNYLPLGMMLGLVPLLWIESEISRERPASRSTFWTIFKFAFVQFFTWNILTTYWVLNTGFVAGVLANVLNSVFMALPIVAFHLIKRQHNEKIGYLAFVSLWLSFEWWHFYWQVSWPWLTLGHAFGHLPQFIQWYEWTGTAGGSLWILLLNLFAFQALRSAYNVEAGTWDFSQWTQLSRRFALLLLLPIAVSLVRYFTYTEDLTQGREVVLVQPNYEPHFEKFHIKYKEQWQRFSDLSKGALTDTTHYLVFPETSIDAIDFEIFVEDPKVVRMRELLAAYPKTLLIAGISGYLQYRDAKTQPPNTYKSCNKSGTSCIYYSVYNSAIQLTADTATPAPIYHKSKLVPGAETIPYIGDIEFFRGLIMNLGGAQGQGLHTQEQREVFASAYGNVAPIICYESVYGDYVTEYTRLGAQVFFVVTNDGWWGDTEGYRQHKYMSAIRAIENRRYVARAANSGTSCVINSRGDIVSATNYNEATALRARVYMQRDITFYVRYGGLIGRISLLLSLLLLVSAVAKTVVPNRKEMAARRKEHDVQ